MFLQNNSIFNVSTSLTNHLELKQDTKLKIIPSPKQRFITWIHQSFESLFPKKKSEYATPISQINISELPQSSEVHLNPDEKSSKLLKTAEKIRLGTYNILFPQIKFPPNKFCTTIGYSADENGKLYNNIDSRLEIIQKNLHGAKLDVVCLQEVTKKIYNILSEAFANDYHLIWAAHPNSFHGVAVLYKKGRFSKLSSSPIAVSIPTHDKTAGSTFLKERIHLMVDLQDVTSKKVFRVVSCHLLDPRDHINKDIHVKEVVDSVEPMSEDYCIDRTIIAGDMNQDQFGDKGVKGPQDLKKSNSTTNDLNHISAFKPLLEHHFYTDGNLAPSSFYKTNYENGPILASKRRIDWIWSKNFQPVSEELPSFDNTGSDHALVVSTIC